MANVARGLDEVQVIVGGAVRVPLLGVVAAGVPFRVFPVEEVLELPAGLWNGRRVFALRVRGASMVDEGIHDGDYLIVEPREAPSPVRRSSPRSTAGSR
jgi:repressor LexA